MSTYTKGNYFEHRVAKVFRSKGYRVQVTKATGDCGIDLILRKGGKTIGVECKNYNKSQKIGRPVVQKLDSALNHNPYSRKPFDYGFIVTSSEFSRDAVEHTRLINSHSGYERLQLIDGRAFKAMQGNHRLDSIIKIWLIRFGIVVGLYALFKLSTLNILG